MEKSVTAAQRALAIPEILDQILTWICLDSRPLETAKRDAHERSRVTVVDSRRMYVDRVPDFGSCRILLNCGCVSRHWWSVAMPILWGDIRRSVPRRSEEHTSELQSQD